MQIGINYRSRERYIDRIKNLSVLNFKINHIDYKLMKNLPYASVESPGLLRKIAAFVVTLAMFGLALMFSVLFFAVVLTAGAAALGYLWWKPRALRKQMRMHARDTAPVEREVFGGEVIEGEVIREDDLRDGK